MGKYTYKIAYTSYEESQQWILTSNTKYTQKQLQQILHDEIINYIKQNPKINTFNWETLLDTRYKTNPLVLILEEKYDLKLTKHEYTTTLTYWGWSRITSEEPEPGFTDETPTWQQQINQELTQILKTRKPTPHNNGFK